jgi:molecular chaperone HtpG
MAENSTLKGNKEEARLSIHADNILPIIKKWLYSDKEIFTRELVSNAVDACNKLKHLSLVGEYKEEIGNLEINIKIDSKNKTLTFSDNGIGMTREEIKKYINQIAFSGAEEFLSKYKEIRKKIRSSGTLDSVFIRLSW